jgi:hypothetical protein
MLPSGAEPPGPLQTGAGASAGFASQWSPRQDLHLRRSV